MSAILNNRILVAVTAGDCLDSNRKVGKSNTGTYFICSKKEYADFESFFLSSNKYTFDIKRINIYGTLFKEYFYDRRNEYKGKMKNFHKYMNYLVSQQKYSEVEISTRQNDERVFMKFFDNTSAVTNAFRNILYQDISYIVLEKNNNDVFLYPEINKDLMEIKNNYQSSLVFDE